MKYPTAELHAGIDAGVNAIAALHEQVDRIAAIGSAMVDCLRRGGKVLTAGNGGSAAEALHLAEELVGRFLANRPSLAGVALVADPTALTCIANDFGYDHVFERQVEGLGRAGDMLVLFSTSGRAENLRLALQAARARQVTTVALLGRDGGPLAGQADFEVIVAGSATARIQEVHQVVMHLLLAVVEKEFAPTV